MVCTDLDGDGLLGALDFLDFPELGAYLACSGRLSRHGVAAWDARSWRMRSLDARIPSHVKWRPEIQEAPLLGGLGVDSCRAGSLQACAFWRLARGVQLYEQKRFKDAEEELRALLSILPLDSPGRPFAKCRLADTLYGRAVSLNSLRAAQSSRSSTPASAGEAWVEQDEAVEVVEAEVPLEVEVEGEVVEDGAEVEVEVEGLEALEGEAPLRMPYSPLSPAREGDLMRSVSTEDAPQVELTSSTASTPTPPLATPRLWSTSWTPPLEDEDEAEAQEAEAQDAEEAEEAEAQEASLSKSQGMCSSHFLNIDC